MRWMHSLCALSALLNSAPTLTAQETSQTLQEKLLNAPPIVRVEEDWELLIACPVPEQNLPQIVTVFGPTDADFGFFLDNSRLPVARGVVIEVDSSTPDEVVATLVHILNEKMAFGFFWAIVLV